MNFFDPEPPTEEERVREIYGLDEVEAAATLLHKLQMLEDRLRVNSRAGNPDLTSTVRRAVKGLISSGAEWVGTGTSRIAFTFPGSNLVIKVPYSTAGYTASMREEQAFQDFKKYPHLCTPIAECSFIDFSSTFGMNLLVMEHLHEFPETLTGLPGWVHSVDCGQVGYNSKKKLVAYDL